MSPVEEPTLFPVVQAITGTTPRGGGTWRWILREHPQGLFRAQRPAMVQALHFKDYPSITPKHLARWREKPLRAHYNGALGLDYRAPLFVDSGGYLWLVGPPPILRAYGLEKPLEVFRLGLDLVDAPGDRVTPLDYPIPPGLSEAEARRRMRGTLDNALEALRFLARDPKGERVRLVLPVHGRTPEEAAAFAQKALRRVRKEGLAHLLWGLGLGSMVPLRKAHRAPEIVHFARAVREAAPELPLHVFGVTGLLVPFLLQAGATSFDSAGYVQKARSLKYLVPGYRERRLPELLAEGDYPCSCPVCRGRSLVEDLEALRSGEAPRGAKSAVYGAVALHNLGMDYALLEEARVRREAGELEGFLRELVAVHPRLSPLLLALGGKERKSKRLAAPKAASVPRRVRNDPEAFDWRKTDFKPQSPVLLLLPCASEKPYTEARSLKPVLKAVADLPVDVVFLSGLYGPVPLPFARHPAVLSYDFLLQRGDEEAYRRVRERLLPLLDLYPKRVAYLAPPAYREVARGLPLLLLPEDNRGLYTGRRRANLERLRKVLQELLKGA